MADSSCSNSDDHYVSLGRSNDSTEDTVKKVLAGTQRAESEEDSMSTTVGGDSVHQSKSSSAATDLEEFPIPKPLSSFEVKDFQEALMGELEGHYYSSESLLGLPSPLVLARRLKRLNFRKTFEFKYRNRSFWPFLPLLVKAEINPILTVAEGILTWIVILSWVQAVVYGGSVVGFVGGVALFFDLTILHYWYGKWKRPRCDELYEKSLITVVGQASLDTTRFIVIGTTRCSQEKPSMKTLSKLEIFAALMYMEIQLVETSRLQCSGQHLFRYSTTVSHSSYTGFTE